ncbi:MAG: ATP synthase F1 subunit gamma [Candidatus Brocadiae bacterium]|nr:ATP synthase F1 subunit gamma [Candidatus Brocadiia bacterium]
MASFREIKRRIGGVKNIQQITRAMKMVAAARLRRAEEAILALRPYSSRLDTLCARFLGDAIGSEHAFMNERPVKGVAVLSICSDRGLCGAYNNRIVDATQGLLRGRADQRHFLLFVGHRGVSRLARAGRHMHRTYEDIFDPVHFTTAQAIRHEVEDLFLSGRVDEVLVVFTEFFSLLRQHVVTRRLLPCPPERHRQELADHYGRELPDGLHVEPAEMDRAAEQVYIYEPDYETIGDRLLEYNLTVQIYRTLLEAQASEHGARMMAMDNATQNAEEMVEEMTLLMNRVRQEDSTREILDVVGGAEAVK